MGKLMLICHAVCLLQIRAKQGLINLIREGRQWFLGKTKIPATSYFIIQWSGECGPSCFCRCSLTPNSDSQLPSLLCSVKNLHKCIWIQLSHKLLSSVIKKKKKKVWVLFLLVCFKSERNVFSQYAKFTSGTHCFSDIN